jgi:hypothetical protein
MRRIFAIVRPSRPLDFHGEEARVSHPPRQKALGERLRSGLVSLALGTGLLFTVLWFLFLVWMAIRTMFPGLF